VLGEAAVGRIEDEVEFVDARRNGFGAEFGERAEKRLGVVDVEFDFDFGRHGGEGRG